MEHDCVIVPQLGGFVSNYRSAKIDTLKNKFIPPSKEISFNKNLTNNDGLLANFIAATENKTYQEANEIIGLDVETLRATFKTGKKIVLEQVGTLYIDAQQKIQFEPDTLINYSKESFGLNSFYALPIEKKQENDRTIHLKSRDKQSPLPKQPSSILSKNAYPINKRKKYILAAFPFVLYLCWLSFYTDIQSKSFSYSDLNPFIKKICPEYQLRHSGYDYTLQETLEDNTLMTLQIADTINTLPFSFFDKTQPEYAHLKDVIIKVNHSVPITTYVQTSKPELFRYYIIGGCFQILTNAKKLVKNLQKNGYKDAAIIGKHKGLYRVSYQGFLNKEEASKALKDIQNSHLSTAWLLTN